MTWAKWQRERARDFIATAAAAGPWPQMKEQAARLLAELPEEPIPVPVGGRGRGRASSRKSGGGVDKSALPFAPNVGPTQRDRKAERNERMRVLRIRVLARARGRCEFRCTPPGMPTDAHHVLGGADRVALESVYTLAAVCSGSPDSCHGRCNASPAWAREQGLAWARRMAAAARSAGDAIGGAEFDRTAELLEGRVALAAAQAKETA